MAFYLIITRGPVIAWVAAGALSDAVGGEVTIASASYVGEGWVQLDGVTVRARGLPGRAGDIASARTITAQLDLENLARADVQLLDVLVEGLRLRLSEQAGRPGSFNFMKLTPKSSRQSGKPLRPPQIRIRSAVVEFGEHEGEQFTLNSSRAFSGWMTPSQHDSDDFIIRLNELNRPTGEGLRLSGHWNASTFASTVEASDFALDDRFVASLPTSLRTSLESMQLSGKLSHSMITLDEQKRISAEFEVLQTTLTLPVDAGNGWSGFSAGSIVAAEGRPRMNLRSGTIRFNDDEVSFDQLVGTLESTGSHRAVDVPYNVSLRVWGLRDLIWSNATRVKFSEALDIAPFELKMSMSDFSLPQSSDGDPPMVELPTVVAGMLQKFNMSGWELDTEVTARRAPPQVIDGRLSPSPPEWSGQAYITHAAGMYQKFRYPLTNVEAYLKFDQASITVEYLRGTGSSGCPISIHGRIAPPLNDSEVVLKVTVQNAPIDDAFREALGNDQRKAVDMLFHKPSTEALNQAGLLPTDATAAAAEVKRRDLLRFENEDSWRTEELQRLERVATNSPFELGGHLDLDLDIYRPPGADQPTWATGNITVRDASLCVEHFPYPFRVTSGTLRLDRDSISIGEGGLRVESLSGGIGRVEGRVDIPKVNGRRRVAPNLQISVVGDVVNDLLLSSIPPTGDDREHWPGVLCSDAAQLIHDAPLSGTVDAGGYVTTEADGRVNWDFAIRLRNGRLGSLAPKKQWKTQREGLNWPSSLVADDVESLLRVNRNFVELSQMQGRIGDGLIGGSMYLDLRDQSAPVIDVEFSGVPIESELLTLLPARVHAKAVKLWQRFDPQGTFGGAVHAVIGRETPPTTDVTLFPEVLEVTLDHERRAFHHLGGLIRYSGPTVMLDQLRLALLSGETPEASLALEGQLSTENDGFSIKGQLTDVVLNSPLPREILSAQAPPEVMTAWNLFQPSGIVNVDLSLARTAGGPLDYRIEVTPDELTANVEQTRVGVLWTSGSAIITPDSVTLNSLTGEYSDGRVAIGGSLALTPTPSADLELSLQGDRFGDELKAFLPHGVRQALESLQLAVDQHISITDGRLHFGETGEGGTAMQFTGNLAIRSARFTAGLDFTQVDAEIDLAVNASGGHLDDLRAEVRSPTMLAAGRRLTDVTTLITLSANGQQIDVADIQGSIYDGIVTGSAHVGLASTESWLADFEMVGADLGRLSRREDADPSTLPSSARQGETYASVSLQGVHGQPEARTGRGSIIVRQGKMATFPITLRLLQLSQLMLPIEESLDEANIEFYLRGNQVTFDQFQLRCPTLRLRGEGGLTLPDFNLDLRLFTRGTLALVSDVVGTVSENLFAIQLNGPIGDPKARIIALPGLSNKPKTDATAAIDESKSP